MNMKCLLGKHDWSTNPEKCSQCGKTIKASYVSLDVSNKDKLSESDAGAVIVLANTKLSQLDKAGIRNAIRWWWRTLPVEKIVLVEGVNIDDAALCLGATYKAVAGLCGKKEPNAEHYVTEGTYIIREMQANGIPGRATSVRGRMFFWSSGF